MRAFLTKEFKARSSKRKAPLEFRVLNFAFALLFALPPLWLGAVEIEPVLRTFRQPDGKTFSGYMRGDEFVVFFETAEGYSMAQNDKGFWCYAATGPDGFLRATAHIVGEGDPAAFIGEKHRRHAPQVMAALQGKRAAHYENMRLLAPAAYKRNENPSPISGAATSYKLAVLLIEFPDVRATYAPADFASLLFSENHTFVSPAPGEPAYGSLRDYYWKMSDGALNITGEVFDWVMADSGKDHYESRGNLRFEAVNKSGVHLNAFDGYAVIYAGTVGASGGNLWPQTFAAGGKLHYVMSEKWLPRYDFAPIGVHCHEFGHLLGLPDLYDTDFSSVGAGRWCTMSTGNYGGGNHERPYHFCAWSKVTLGWLTPQTLYEGAHANLMLPPIASHRQSYKLISLHSYFLLENRQKLDYDLNLPGEGLLIWHVDERFGSQAIDAHRLLDLEEADGAESGGDAGDPFPGRSNNFSFGGNTLPSSRDYDGKSYVEVSNIAAVTADIRFDAALNLGPGAGIAVNGRGNFPGLFPALEAAFPQGTVRVPRGYYSESNLLLKEGVNLQGEGAAATFINGGGNLIVEARNIAHGKISGFTFLEGATAITVVRANVEIVHNIIANMAVDGISCFDTEAGIRNNTIVNAAASGISCLARAAPRVRNNILAYNGAGVAQVAEAAPVLAYNDVWNNLIDYQNAAPGAGDLSANPEFASPFLGDYRLAAGSPCIDAGDPGFLDDDGTRSDMGAIPYHALPSPAESGVRLNAGGNQVMAPDSSFWRQDLPYTAGSAGFVGGRPDSTADAIAQTDFEELYQNARVGVSAYLADLPNGRYLVRLHFAEIEFEAPGQRIFDVALEGLPFLEKYDIYAVAGHDVARQEELLAQVQDGQLALEFAGRTGEPLLSALEILPSPPGFIDVAEFAKVADPGAGAGVALGDYDGDGDADIFVANAVRAGALFQNNGLGVFLNQTRAAGMGAADNCEAAIWGDYDNNGLLDLYIVRNQRPCLLYRNLGNGSFLETGALAGVTNDGAGRSAAWGDFDHDGHLDLFVANAGPNKLYRNNGNGTFSEIARQAGLENSASSTGAIWGDFNNDGFLDLYVTHLDHTFLTANLLYLNNRDRTFTAMALGKNGLGATAADYDNDGDPDIFMIATLNALGAGRHYLFRNDGENIFSEVAEAAGLTAGMAGHSAAWGDFDNDGRLDLHIAGANKDRQIFRNNGDGTFSDVSQAAGVAGQSFAKTSACADFNLDGALDIYLVNDSHPNALYQNQSHGQNWLAVRLRGRESNRAAIGARAQVITNGLRQWREVSGGSGFRAQADLALMFGLGKSAAIDTLRILWPGGAQEVFTDIRNLNRVFEIVEGVTVGVAGGHESKDAPADYYLSQNYPNPVGRDGNLQTQFRYALPKPGKVSLKVFNLLGQEIAIVFDHYQNAGWHSISWLGRDRRGYAVPPGVYFYRLQADGYSNWKKMIILRQP